MCLVQVLFPLPTLPLIVVVDVYFAPHISAFFPQQYLVVDTQMIVGGTHKFQISSEEYVFASLTLYLDVINIFLYILQIISAANRS